jgi:RimJ/RimL family protein N-acetyltransferase
MSAYGLREPPEEIATARLRLHAPRPEDGLAVNAAVAASHREFALWLPWAIDCPTVADSSEWCAAAAGRRERREEIAYLLSERDGGAVVGSISLLRGDWEVGRFEIGYWCRSDRVGRGYVAEAVQAMVRLAFSTLGLQRVEIRCDARNARSIRVAERAGFLQEGRLRHDALANDDSLRDTLVYGLLASDLVI